VRFKTGFTRKSDHEPNNHRSRVYKLEMNRLARSGPATRRSQAVKTLCSSCIKAHIHLYTTKDTCGFHSMLEKYLRDWKKAGFRQTKTSSHVLNLLLTSKAQA